MGVIGPCDVVLTTGEVIEDTAVLFRDNGWVRLGWEGSVTFLPPHIIESIEYHRDHSVVYDVH
jgi:hypothetical protein